MPRPIYVERFIRAPMQSVVDATQTPQLHERWDLRFTEIRYLARESERDPQRFLYATRIGLGIRIAGEGETVGERDRGGDRTSALRFWSDDPRSLIREGSGYWRYVAQDGGIRFSTLYDYETRFGRLGGVIDLAFRPLLGWATAWSFDRLRVWLERGIDPARSLERTATHWIARSALSFIWLYHGVAPKLVGRTGEIDLATRIGVPQALAPSFVLAAGVIEVVFGAALLVAPRPRLLLVLSALAAVAFGVVTVAAAPELLVAPFQPVTIGVAMVALSFVALAADRDLPRAANCLRRPRSER